MSTHEYDFLPPHEDVEDPYEFDMEATSGTEPDTTSGRAS